MAALLAISIATAPFATALAGPAEDKATARDLAKDGIAAEQKGDCATAIDHLERAESLYHAPVHLQYLARCYAKVGRLVAATESWRKLTLESLPPNAPQAFKDAVAEAQVELPKMEPRLARLTVQTKESYPGLVVEVDGKAWSSAAIGVPRVIDPGKHTVAARATGFKRAEKTVQLGEGASDSITLELQPGQSEVGPAASASASATTTSSAVPTATSEKPPSKTMRTVGIVAGATGVVMVASGIVFYFVGKSKRDTLLSDCGGHANDCAVPDLDSRKSTLSTYETLHKVLTIGGGVVFAAGVGLFLLSPSPKTSGASVSLRILPEPQGGHVALTGTF